jgi:flagellar assembly protein FliH
MVMTSSPELQRTVVLRGVATQQARPARMFSELRTSPFVGRFVVDPRLVDPTLEAVVAEAEERARAAGWARGRDEGREAGLTEVTEQAAALEQARAERLESGERRREQVLAQALDALRLSSADLDAREAPVFQDIERSVATMAVRIAEVLVGRHLELGKWSALDAVHRALALAPRQSAAVVRVHPDAVSDLPDLSAALPGGSVTVVSDPSVEIGGCIVEAGNRTIDAQLGPALQRLREVLA